MSRISDRIKNKICGYCKWYAPSFSHRFLEYCEYGRCEHLNAKVQSNDFCDKFKQSKDSYLIELLESQGAIITDKLGKNRGEK